MFILVLVARFFFAKAVIPLFGFALTFIVIATGLKALFYGGLALLAWFIVRAILKRAGVLVARRGGRAREDVAADMVAVMTRMEGHVR